MTDNSMPDLKVQVSRTDEQELAAPTLAESNLNNGPAEPCKRKVQVAVLKLSRFRVRELTEEEKAEEARRRKEIWAGRHPDTGQRLKRSDRKTLKPHDIWELQMYLDAARQRAINMSLYDAPFRDNFHRAMNDASRHPTVQLWRDDLSIRGLLDASHARQAQINASLGKMENEIHYNQMAQIDVQRRFIDPLLDPDFVNRITGGVSSDLMKRATELHDAHALQDLRETVEAAATTQIVEHWKITSVFPGSSILVNEAAVRFQQDFSVMAREAERMLSIYGPSITEQTRFLNDYQSNLGLFHPRLNAGAFEGADLLARIALPTNLLPGFEDYQHVRVQRLRTYARAQLTELKNDFERDENPLFVWEAFSIARSCGVKVPDWVLDQFADAAEKLLDVGEENHAGRSLTEAELVGKALGFSQGGRGQTGRFAHAKQVQRDREIYFQVVEWLSEHKLRKPKFRPKLTGAYAETAGRLGLDVSTVGRAYRRIKKYSGGDDEAENQD